jgi:hypothetical protein
MSAFSFEEYSKRRGEGFLRNKSIVQIGTFHPLNNPNRPEFMSSSSAARALFRHAYGNLSGQVGDRATYWNNLQEQAALGIRNPENEQRRDLSRSREVVVAMNATDDDVSPEQLEGGYLSAMARQSLYAGLSDNFTRTEKEKIITHLTARAIGEATGNTGEVRPARGAIGREAETAAQSDSYTMLVASVSQIWNTTRSNPIDDQRVDFDNLDDDQIVEQAEMADASRLRKTRNVVQSFADSYLLDQVDEVVGNDRNPRSMGNAVVVMETADEAAVMKALLDWTARKSQENGGELPSIEEIRHELRTAEDSVYKQFTEGKTQVIRNREVKSTAAVEGLLALSDENYLAKSLKAVREGSADLTPAQIAEKEAKVVERYQGILANGEIRNMLMARLSEERVRLNGMSPEEKAAADKRVQGNGRGLLSDDLQELNRDLRANRDRSGNATRPIPHTAEIAKLAALYVSELNFDTSKSAREGGEWVKFSNYNYTQKPIFSSPSEEQNVNRTFDRSNPFSALRATVIDGTPFYKNVDAIKDRVAALHADNRLIEQAARDRKPMMDGDTRLYPAAILVGNNSSQKMNGLGAPQKAVLESAEQLGMPVVNLTVSYNRAALKEASTDGEEMRRLYKNEMSYVVSKTLPNPALREGEPRSVTVDAFLKSDEGKPAIDLALRQGEFGHRDVLPRSMTLTVEKPYHENTIDLMGERHDAEESFKSFSNSKWNEDGSVLTATIDLRDSKNPEIAKAMELLNGNTDHSPTKMSVTVDLLAKDAASRQNHINVMRDAFSRTNLPAQTVTVSADLMSKDSAERRRARDMMQGSVVLVDGYATNAKSREVNESQGRMIRWQALVDMARNVEVFGYGVGSGARDYNASQLIRQAADQGKLREIYDDTGRPLENHSEAYAKAKGLANNKEETALKAIQLDDKNNESYVNPNPTMKHAYTRLLIHHMHIERSASQISSLSKIDATVKDLFDVAAARHDGGRSLDAETRERFKGIAKAIPADTFALESVEQIRKIAHASSQARLGMLRSKDSVLEFDAPAAKSGPIVKNGTRSLDDGTRNVLMVGGEGKPTEAQLKAIDDSVKAVAAKGFGVVTILGSKANEAVVDAALRHDAKLTVVTPQSNMVRKFQPEERAVLARVLDHKDGVVIGKYELGRADPIQALNDGARNQKPTPVQERAAYQIASDMSDAVVLTKAKETERVVYEVAKFGQNRPAATLPAYEIADTGNRLLTVPFETARSTRIIGTAVSASFSSSMNTEADANRTALRDNASIWMSKREANPLVNVHEKGEVTVQWHDPAAHMKTRGTVESFVEDWAQRVAEGKERGMMNPEIRHERDLDRARNFDTEVKDYALYAKTEGLVTDESDRDIHAVTDYRQVEDRMLESLDRRSREIANQNDLAVTPKRAAGGKEM